MKFLLSYDNKIQKKFNKFKVIALVLVLDECWVVFDLETERELLSSIFFF